MTPMLQHDVSGADFPSLKTNAVTPPSQWPLSSSEVRWQAHQRVHHRRDQSPKGNMWSRSPVGLSELFRRGGYLPPGYYRFHLTTTSSQEHFRASHRKQRRGNT